MLLHEAHFGIERTTDASKSFEIIPNTSIVIASVAEYDFGDVSDAAKCFEVAHSSKRLKPLAT